MFCLEKYAAFEKGSRIRDEFLKAFEAELKPVIEALGLDKVKKSVYEKVKGLSPKNRNFPKKYKTTFETLRQQWTEEARNVRGYHRTARIQFLDDLLNEVMARPIDEGEKPQFTYKDKIQLALKIISEMRLEGDKSQVHVQAEIEHAPNMFENPVNDLFQSLTDEQMEKIRELQDAGKPIQPFIEGLVRDNVHAIGSGGTPSPNGVQSGGDEA